MFSLSPIYSARKPSNHKLFKNHKIVLYTNLHKTKHTQTSNDDDDDRGDLDYDDHRGGDHSEDDSFGSRKATCHRSCWALS